MKMLLKSLHIYSDVFDRNKVSGKISFEGVHGEITVNLNRERVSKILAVVAQEVVDSANDVAKMMVSSVIDQVEKIDKRGDFLDDTTIVEAKS